MRNNTVLLSLVATLALVGSSGISAEEVVVPQAAASAPSMPAMPPRGATMDSVKEKFGAPAQEVPAIGQPPITRWEYPGYVVFFEHDRVLHTVVVSKAS